MVNLSHKKKAFTLAELLVAMLVFGVIASMLIPNVSNNAEKNLFATQLLKVQNDVQQALLLLMSENQGTLQALCSGDSPNECLRNLIAEKLETKVLFSGSKIPDTDITSSGIRKVDIDAGKCSNTQKPDKNPCIQQKAFETRDPIFLNKTGASNLSCRNTTYYHAVNLTNGASISTIFTPACNCTPGENGTCAATFTGIATDISVCGYMEIDINAGKKPNIVGKDIHYFWIVDKDGLVPFGEIDKATCGEVDTNGNITESVTKAEGALTQFGCTFKLVQDGKINYY